MKSILIDDEIACVLILRMSETLITFFLPFVGPLIYRTGETAVPLSFLFCSSNRRIMEEDFHFSLYIRGILKRVQQFSS